MMSVPRIFDVVYPTLMNVAETAPGSPGHATGSSRASSMSTQASR